MRQGIVMISKVTPEQLQSASMNIPLLFLLIFVLVFALVVCHKLAKKYHIYESKKKDVLKHT